VHEREEGKYRQEMFYRLLRTMQKNGKRMDDDQSNNHLAEKTSEEGARRKKQ